MPLLEMHQLDGGWVGVVDPDWGGVYDSAMADEACARLALRMELKHSGTISLYDIEGSPLVECSL